MPYVMPYYATIKTALLAKPLTQNYRANWQNWQARRDSNPQHPVLETGALPIELLAYHLNLKQQTTLTTKPRHPKTPRPRINTSCIDYSIILATTPAPTVRPPSRIAKRRPSSIAIGAMRVTVICTLSPGMTISTPSGSSQAPVTSVVRK